MITTQPVTTGLDWPAIIQAASAVVLALVTIVYVFLTYRLVKHAGRQAAAVTEAHEREARRRLWMAVRSIRIELEQIATISAAVAGGSTDERELPTRAWDHYRWESVALDDHQLARLLDAYEQVWRCNQAREAALTAYEERSSSDREVRTWRDRANTVHRAAEQALRVLPATQDGVGPNSHRQVRDPVAMHTPDEP